LQTREAVIPVSGMWFDAMILHARDSSWGFIGLIIASSGGSNENFNLKTWPQTIMHRISYSKYGLSLKGI
jgi:hypothetical protein